MTSGVWTTDEKARIIRAAEESRSIAVFLSTADSGVSETSS